MYWSGPGYRTTDERRFTAHRVYLWGVYFATLAAIFSTLPGTSVSFGVAASAAVIFAGVDFKLIKHFRGWLGVTYFTCVMAYVVAIGYVTIQLFPPPPIQFRPESLAALLDNLFDGAIRDFIQTLNHIIITVQYLGTIFVCTLMSTTIALFTLLHEHKSRWLLTMNTPGILLSIGVITAFITI